MCTPLEAWAIQTMHATHSSSLDKKIYTLFEHGIVHSSKGKGLSLCTFKKNKNTLVLMACLPLAIEIAKTSVEDAIAFALACRYFTYIETDPLMNGTFVFFGDKPVAIAKRTKKVSFLKGIMDPNIEHATLEFVAKNETSMFTITFSRARSRLFVQFDMTLFGNDWNTMWSYWNDGGVQGTLVFDSHPSKLAWHSWLTDNVPNVSNSWSIENISASVHSHS